MNRTICVHTLDINNYFPELTKLTLPTIERFCSKIGAKLNVITKRKYPNLDILTEKLQVYNDGFNYDYNIFLDLDILVHPLCYNPFEKNIPPTHVAFKDGYHASNQLASDIYFKRDERNVGISTCAVYSSRFTHDLWRAIDDLTIEQINNNILQDRKIVDEYTLSRNFAKYSLKYTAPYPMSEYNYTFHLGAFDQDKNIMLEKAKVWCKTFWK